MNAHSAEKVAAFDVPTSFPDQAVTRIFTQADMARAWDEGHENSDCAACRYYGTDHNPYRDLPPGEGRA